MPVEVEFRDGKILIAPEGIKAIQAQMLKMTGKTYDEAIIIRKLEEAAQSIPRAPPFRTIILFTPQTTKVKIPGVDEECYIISEYVYDEQFKQNIIKAQPIVLESDDILATLLFPAETNTQKAISQAKKFIITALRDEFGHLPGVVKPEGLNQVEGDQYTLAWLGENSEYLEANIAVLDEANENGIYAIGDWFKWLVRLNRSEPIKVLLIGVGRPRPEE